MDTQPVGNGRRYSDVTWDNVSLLIHRLQRERGGFVRIQMAAGVGKTGSRSIHWLAYRVARMEHGPEKAVAKLGGYYPSREYRTAPSFVFTLLRGLERVMEQQEADRLAQSSF